MLPVTWAKTYGLQRSGYAELGVMPDPAFYDDDANAAPEIAQSSQMGLSWRLVRRLRPSVRLWDAAANFCAHEMNLDRRTVHLMH
jgi:hypothetical protein